MRKFVRRYRKGLIAFMIAGSIVYYFLLPKSLFHDPYSTVLVASDGTLLSAAIAADGQWRFPEEDTVSLKFAEALIAFEDKRFRSHPGIDVLSIARATRQNISAGKVVSGGSTITMQVIRLSRKGKSRTLTEKLIEVILATRLELRYTKNEILALYAAHAPFGGNVVGLEAACWRYFGVGPSNLSWGQSALLAVLPNAPSLIHPGKNSPLLKAKRNRLLDKLKTNGVIDEFTCDLAKAEPIPDAPLSLPRMAPHLLDRLAKEGSAQTKVVSTIDYVLQEKVLSTVARHQQRLQSNQIFNAAVLVLDVNSGNVLAYAGNVDTTPEHSGAVDIVMAPRSTGSILKPILYSAMLDEGKLLPSTILPDIPTMINGFAPKNFSKQYDGAVHADQALTRSLNIPAVHMLRDFRYEKLHQLLKDVGMTTLHQPADHYGLSLILGGAEGTLWDVTGVYASMARTLNRYFERPGKNRYTKNDFHAPRYVAQKTIEKASLEANSHLSAASIYLTFQALKELYRPGEETGWRHFSGAKDIAWKTGTSFGFRDGWAVGVTPRYAVGVWVGNADGEGRPGLTGTDAAAPLMFDIFSALPAGKWFQLPRGEMHEVATCVKSGHRASEICEQLDTIWVTKAALETTACTYHRTVHLSHDMKFRVHSQCISMNEMKHVNWFVLPPVQEYYFRSKNLSYRPLPPYRAGCVPSANEVVMDMIYPKPDSKIFIPRELNGSPGSSVFQLAHRDPKISVFWHLDGVYVGSTTRIHQFELAADEGKHTLVVVDEKGESVERHFEVISKM